MTETRFCTICNSRFEFVRTVGRPPELCGADCRQESTRRRQRRWKRRLIDAREQLAAIQAQAA